MEVCLGGGGIVVGVMGAYEDGGCFFGGGVLLWG